MIGDLNSANGLFAAWRRALTENQAEHVIRDAVALLVVEACAAELLCGHRRDVVPALDLDLLREMMIERALAVVEHKAQRAGEHLLEADRQHAIRRPAFDRLPRKVERGRSGRAIVVHVDDRNTGAADSIERRLARSRNGVDIAGISLLDLLIADAGFRRA